MILDARDLYVCAAWKPVLKCRGGLQLTGTAVRKADVHSPRTTWYPPFAYVGTPVRVKYKNYSLRFYHSSYIIINKVLA